MVEAVKNRSFFIGAQPRSLQINWMKYDVSKENIDPNTMKSSAEPKRLSPLRLKLQKKGEEVMLKRQHLTHKQINSKIQDTRLRREFASADVLKNKALSSLANHSMSKNRHQYLSEMARKRQDHEEAIIQEITSTLKRVKAKQDSLLASRDSSIEKRIPEKVNKADETSEAVKAADYFKADDSDLAKGLNVLNQMNINMEGIIEFVYNKMKSDRDSISTSASLEQTVTAGQ